MTMSKKRISLRSIMFQGELHLIYRPRTFEDFLGNSSIKKSIKSTIGKKHCYLLYGTRGCGKTTLGRIIGLELGVKENSFDFFEINAADKTSIADTRKLMDEVGTYPIQSPYKIYLIDEAHRLSVQAQDSILTTLEEPPPHIVFILCTTAFEKLSVTIRSRAGKYKVTPLNKEDMRQLLTKVIVSQDIKVSKRIINTIILKGQGVPRETLILLDQIRYMESMSDMLDFLETDEEDEDIVSLCQLLIKKKEFLSKWKGAVKILTENLEGDSPEEVRRRVLNYMSKVLYNTGSTHIANIIEIFSNRELYDPGTAKAELGLLIYNSCRL